MRTHLLALSLLWLTAEAQAQSTNPTGTNEPLYTLPPANNPPPALPPPSNPGGRPEGLTFGLGVGLQAPQGAFGLNAVSARLRLTSGLTLEPIVIGAFDQANNAVTINGVTVNAETTTTNLTLAAGVRYPVASRGPVDFLVLGVPAVTVNKIVDDPDGNANNTITKTQAFSVNWGLGLEWFIRPKISTSFNALNPLLVFSNQNSEDEANVVTTENKDFQIGAIFAPIIQVLVHIYF